MYMSSPSSALLQATLVRTRDRVPTSGDSGNASPELEINLNGCAHT